MSASPAPTRRPGVVFRDAEPAREDAPRMDVAGFVGFAASGPLDVPVPIDSEADFLDVFGPPVTLGLGADRAPIRTQLAGAVGAFFSEGGARCYVVRVAAREGDGVKEEGVTSQVAAELSRFPLEGAFEFKDGAFTPAALRARSEGSWADDLIVRTSARVAATRVVFSQADDADKAHARKGPELSDTFVVGTVARDALADGDVICLESGNYFGAFYAVARLDALGTRFLFQGLWFRDTVAITPTTSGRATWTGGEGSCEVVGTEQGGASVRIAGQRGPQVGAPVVVELGTERLLLRADELNEERAGDGSTQITISGAALWFVRSTSVPVPNGVIIASRIRLEIAAGPSSGTYEPEHILGELGCHPLHARAIGALPSDEEIFAQGTPDPIREPRRHGLRESTHWQPLHARVRRPRFPLSAEGTDIAIMPLLTRPFHVAPERWLDAVHGGRSALERDGLATPRQNVFVDRALAPNADAGTAHLREVLHQPRATFGEEARRGVHALLSIDEVTMIAAPDAVQPRVGRASDASYQPEEPAPAPSSKGHTFDGCGPRSIAAPRLTIASEDAAVIRISWTAADIEPEVTYTVEEAAGPGSDAWVVVYRGPEQTVVLRGRRPGSYYYRVRAERGELLGTWSPWWGHTIAGISPNVEISFDAGELRDVHAAMLTMAAYRGDLFAALSVPRTYSVDAISHHINGLSTVLTRDPIGLSHGALYHPWPMRSIAAVGDVPTSPDGFVLGALAERTRTRGAWIAWANRPLREVHALAPLLPEVQRLRLAGLPVNLFETTARGVMTLREDTLSRDPDLDQVHVRRLIATIRRTALRQGTTYVFEPNGPALHSALRSAFYALMRTMSDRGAFVGRSDAERFRIVVSDGTTLGDEARVLVELQFAASRPMEFLTVRLLDRNGLLAMETQ